MFIESGSDSTHRKIWVTSTYKTVTCNQTCSKPFCLKHNSLIAEQLAHNCHRFLPLFTKFVHSKANSLKNFTYVKAKRVCPKKIDLFLQLCTLLLALPVSMSLLRSFSRRLLVFAGYLRPILVRVIFIFGIFHFTLDVIF